MRSFLVSALYVAVAAVGAAALVRLAPLAYVAAGAGVLLIAVVFSAARAGSPRPFGVRHLAGLLFAGMAILIHWGALIGFAAASGDGLAGFDGAAVLAVLMAPGEWLEAVQDLAARTDYQAGGSVINGPALATAWAIEAGLIALFGLMGGQAARWRQHSRL